MKEGVLYPVETYILINLAAVALGLGSCQIAAFYDDEFNHLLGLDGNNESVIYLTAVGRI